MYWKSAMEPESWHKSERGLENAEREYKETGTVRD